jgi:acyl dehydratase
VSEAAPTPTAVALLWYEDLAVGSSWVSGRRTVTEADVVAFAGVSGDFNPLHVDEVAASAGPFGRRVVHGALVFSMATGLRQQMGIFNGSLKALMEIRSWRFTAPVFIGDTIAAVTTVVSMKETQRPGQGVVVQRVDVVNQDGATVQTGEFVSLVLKRPGG